MQTIADLAGKPWKNDGHPDRPSLGAVLVVVNERRDFIAWFDRIWQLSKNGLICLTSSLISPESVVASTLRISPDCSPVNM
jgi:hypothetical protein